LEDSVVDIVGCQHTAPDVIEALRQLALKIRQEPLLLRREHPGYVFNWLLQAVLRSALELAALDVADPPEIDRSWTAVTGMPLGPFGIMDQIGLDVIEQVLSNARWAAPPNVPSEQLLALLSAHTNQGELGVKTKRGFYDYGQSE
jgi:3-hydroxybutyryl-CoA dehydrogenase